MTTIADLIVEPVDVELFIQSLLSNQDGTPCFAAFFSKEGQHRVFIPIGMADTMRAANYLNGDRIDATIVPVQGKHAEKFPYRAIFVDVIEEEEEEVA